MTTASHNRAALPRLRRAHTRRPHAFSLIEVMMAVAMLGILATISFQNYQRFVARAKRVEATEVLRGLATAEEEYWIKNGKFSGSFFELGFDIKVAGGRRVSATEIRGKTYVFNLSQPFGDGSYYASATGNLDDDTWPDVVTIGETR